MFVTRNIRGLLGVLAVAALGTVQRAHASGTDTSGSSGTTTTTTTVPFRRTPLTGAQLIAVNPQIKPSPLPSTTAPLSAGALRFVALNMGLTSLAAVNPPDPKNLSSFVTDRTKLLQLGKALFWEQQLGSDGQACASCHFHAGADSRSKNQLNPGFRNTVPGGDMTFGNSPLQPASLPPFGPNYQLTQADFPLHRLADPTNAGSALLSDTNDVVSSQGSFTASFGAIGIPYDVGQPSVNTAFGPFYNVNGQLVRTTAPRNTPSVVNAIFNYRNFWDSRARAEFNGVNPIGNLDPTAQVVEVIRARGSAWAALHPIQIPGASTASQANGPPLSDVEMSFANRRFADLGRKMLSGQLQPLALQRVAVDDSVLGALSRQRLQPGAQGLAASYLDLVRASFLQQWWDGADWVVDLSGSTPVLRRGVSPGPNVFTVAEYNFSVFFGLAIREYERILIADGTPFDLFMEGDNTALTAQQLNGMQLFLGKAGCFGCHGGPELTNAGITNVARRSALEVLDGRPPVADLLERMIMGDGTVAVYDTGHYNVGVRPTSEDIGIGATIGPINLPLSNTRRFQACVKERVATGRYTVWDANNSCGVSRILARPAEAYQLLKLVATRLGTPDAIVPLFKQADELLGPVNDPLQFSVPDLFAASMPLRQARYILGAMPAASRGAIKQMLDSVDLLLPDPYDPGFDSANPLAPPLQPNERVAVDGSFKVPGLRNVSLTAPYFHNGGQATLAQVVDFYNRGGDFGQQNRLNLDPTVQPLFLTASERADLVSFLEALTDERVRWERAPFDHPSLSLPNGGTAGVGSWTFFPIAVLDDRFELPEVGAGGGAYPLGTPSTAFANFPDPQR